MSSFFDFAERYGTRRGGFRDLMGHQVRHVLLVSSLYESFILAEDGHLADVVAGVLRPDVLQLEAVRARVEAEAGVAAGEEVAGGQHLVSLSPHDHMIT